MYRLSDKYYHRKCYFERNQVPTQSVMKEMMTEPVANIYFKSMNTELKVYAGLEPPMKGGGNEWYMPPEEQLAGRAVLKPIERESFDKLTVSGIREIGDMLKNFHYQEKRTEMQQALLKSDSDWKNKILVSNDNEYTQRSKHESLFNTKKILMAMREFETLYRTSITRLEDTIMTAARKEIQRFQEEAFQHMKQRLAQLLECQATRMYNDYEEKLKKQKHEFKAEFIGNVETIRTDMANKIHDANYEKHLAIEKLRHFLQCQNLACQVYVALKEREECKKELEESKHCYKKTEKKLEDEIILKDVEIKCEMDQQVKRRKFNDIWKNKICQVMKKFQLFVVYCLHQMPQHAEFFINIEKLMILQLSEAVDNPDSESSIIESEIDFATPEPLPHPLYLFCDKGYKPVLNTNLCPKHDTSSDPHFPLVVVNKRCIYSACDNFEVFADKVTQYLHGNRSDDMEDHHLYELNVPIKYTSKTQLQELKLESSLMQILQQEISNLRDLPINCNLCKLPFCYCTEMRVVKNTIEPIVAKKLITGLKTLKDMTIETELQLKREPKWKAYSDYMTSRKCKCAKTIQKRLYDNLPPYMKNMSPYLPPELPHYEICDTETLKKIVKRANKIKAPKVETEVTQKAKDAFTQYSDHAFDVLCTCLSDDELSMFLETLGHGTNAFTGWTKLQLVDGSVRQSSLSKTASSFATARAHSLRKLLDTDWDLIEIFKKTTCE